MLLRRLLLGLGLTLLQSLLLGLLGLRLGLALLLLAMLALILLYLLLLLLLVLLHGLALTLGDLASKHCTERVDLIRRGLIFRAAWWRALHLVPEPFQAGDILSLLLLGQNV